MSSKPERNSHSELVFQESVSGNLRIDLCAGGVSVVRLCPGTDTHAYPHTPALITLFYKNTHCMHFVSAGQSPVTLPGFI